MIPLIDLTMDKSLISKIKKAVGEVIDSKNYILGARLESFEKKFAEFVGAKYAVGVASGTDALRLALRASGIKGGDKVLTVSLTSPFTTIAIVEEGAIPVFCDVDDKTFTIDINDAKTKLDRKTKAIIPVHIFGNPCAMDEIVNFAKENNLKVIEDACQAHGAIFKNKKIGTFGNCGAFSFYPTKNLGGMGDGGMIVTSNSSLDEKIRLLRHGGQTRRFWHRYKGINSRLDEIQAAILEAKLGDLEKNNKKRQKLAERYKEELKNLPLRFQLSHTGAKSVYHLFMIRTTRRDSLKKILAERGITTDIYYPYPVHIQAAFKNYARDDLKITTRLTRELLAIPIYPRLTFRDQGRVIAAIKEIFGHK